MRINKRGQYSTVALLGAILFLAVFAALSIFLVYLLTNPQKEQPSQMQMMSSSSSLLDLARVYATQDDGYGAKYSQVLDTVVELNPNAKMPLNNLKSTLANSKIACAQMKRQGYTESRSTNVELVGAINNCFGTSTSATLFLSNNIVTLKLTR